MRWRFRSHGNRIFAHVSVDHNNGVGSALVTFVAKISFIQGFSNIEVSTSAPNWRLWRLTMLHSKPVYDPPTLAVLWRALGEVLTDHRFLKSTSTSALEIEEFILPQPRTGERTL